MPRKKQTKKQDLAAAMPRSQIIKELKEYEKELGIQYGNFCYYEILQ